jgi:beta-N-acetylhexosaminidase
MNNRTRVAAITAALAITVATATPALGAGSGALPGSPNARVPRESCRGVAQRTVNRMTLREKVGQMVMVLNAPGFGDFTDTISLIRDYGVGSVVSHAYWIGPADAAAYNETLRAAAAQTRLGIPVLNAADFEKGAPILVGPGTTDLPSHMALGATRDLDAVAASAQITASEALALGFDWTFSPVGDVITTPANGETGTRSFGEDPELVASMTALQVETYRSSGLIPTAKHFPGMGGSETNSHFALPRVTYDRDVLEDVHLPPFEAAIAAGVDTIMTGHIVVEALDPDLPASLSRAVTTDLLREELGFDRVIITDSMSLEAIVENWGFEEAPVLAVKAGADIVMEIGPTIVPIIAIEAIHSAVEAGDIPQKQVNDSVRRVLQMKCEYGLFDRDYLGPAEAAAAVGLAEDLEMAAEISRESITLVKNDDVLPFDPDSAESTLVVGVTHEATVIPTPPLSHVPELAALVAAASEGPVSTSIAASESPTEQEIADAVAAAATADRIVVATYASGVLPPEQAALVDALVATGTPVVAISLGTPWDILAYPDVPAYLASYGLNFLPTYVPAPAALAASIDVVFGAEPGGRLPVTVGSLYAFGHGLDYD